MSGDDILYLKSDDDLVPGFSRACVKSRDGHRRYWLSRVMEPGKPVAAWWMLNPSNADHIYDDQPIVRCMRYAKLWGCGGVVVVNLFSWISSDPGDLERCDDPVGPHNAFYVDQVLADAKAGRVKHLMLGWGPRGMFRCAALVALERIRAAGVQPECIDMNRDGSPGHPSRRSYRLKPVAYSVTPG